MNMDEEEFSPYGGYGSGCDQHGEDYLRECTMCGIEFCSACFPHSTLCPDCAAQTKYDDDDDDEPTEEEKELLLLEGFNDDEPAETEPPPPPPPPVRKPAPKPPAQPAPKAKPAPKKRKA